MYKKLNIHFVGSGGIGMSGIAEVLLNLKYPVTGSDIKRSSTTDRLKRRGAKVFVGHKAKNVHGADVIVVSSAITKDNVELVEAKKLGIQVVLRAEMLAEIMRLAKYGIAVAGTHGKTTTTSLLATILHEGGLDPTSVIGGKLKSLRSNAKLGKGDFMVTEADESDGSFLKLVPTIAVVTNMDPEHMEHYGTFDKYRESFQLFCEQIPFYGLAVLCGEHPETKALSKKLDRRVSLYGFKKDYEWNARNIEFDGPFSVFDLYHFDDLVTKIKLGLTGRHNILNALGAIAVACELGVSLANIKKSLKGFKGVGRRMEVLLDSADLTVLDDYGHHPNEIQPTLQAVRNAYAGRLVVLFQPHRYSRTKELFDEFAASFDLADEVLVTEIYAAGESPLKGISGSKLTKAIQENKGGHVQFIKSADQILPELKKQLQPGDVLLTLGAGDVTQYGRQYVKSLKKKKAA